MYPSKAMSISRKLRETTSSCKNSQSKMISFSRQSASSFQNHPCLLKAIRMSIHFPYLSRVSPPLYTACEEQAALGFRIRYSNSSFLFCSPFGQSDNSKLSKSAHTQYLYTNEVFCRENSYLCNSVAHSFVISACAKFSTGRKSLIVLHSRIPCKQFETYHCRCWKSRSFASSSLSLSFLRCFARYTLHLNFSSNSSSSTKIKSNRNISSNSASESTSEYSSSDKRSKTDQNIKTERGKRRCALQLIDTAFDRQVRKLFVSTVNKQQGFYGEDSSFSGNFSSFPFLPATAIAAALAAASETQRFFTRDEQLHTSTPPHFCLSNNCWTVRLCAKQLPPSSPATLTLSSLTPSTSFSPLITLHSRNVSTISSPQQPITPITIPPSFVKTFSSPSFTTTHRTSVPSPPTTSISTFSAVSTSVASFFSSLSRSSCFLAHLHSETKKRLSSGESVQDRHHHHHNQVNNSTFQLCTGQSSRAMSQLNSQPQHTAASPGAAGATAVCTPIATVTPSLPPSPLPDPPLYHIPSASLRVRNRLSQNPRRNSAAAPAGRATATAAAAAVAKCCGIVGYVGNREAEPILITGLEILQNRGYDSCGITSLSSEGGSLTTSKFASKGSTCDSLDLLKKEKETAKHKNHYMGIGHTRWATHGSKSDVNAHPHHDWKNRISLVHNGSIENFSQLKGFLKEKGCVFHSETDSEVIANLIGWHLEDEQGRSFEEAVKAAVSELQGTWGLCVLHRDFPDRLVLARNGSPLLVGAASGQVFVASEPAALALHTNQYFALRDGEIAVITAAGVGQLQSSRCPHSIEREEREIILQQRSPAPFAHWTAKEIFEQPQALARALNYGGRMAAATVTAAGLNRSRVKLGGLDQNTQQLVPVQNLLITGCGTSYYAALYGQLLLQWLHCFAHVKALDACEIDSDDFPANNSAGSVSSLEKSAVLLLSQSGETLDTVKAAELAEKKGLTIFSVVNQVGSLLARMTGCGVYLNAGREVAVASTKAFSCQVTVLSLIGLWFAENRENAFCFSDRCKELSEALHRLPMYAGMTLHCTDACRAVAEKMKDQSSVFILGKGFAYPVALEGALKIKEIACMHAEGFAAGALKHGPFALLDSTHKTPVILLFIGEQNNAVLLSAAQQIKARGAQLICITDTPQLVKELADDLIVIPSNGPLTALLACIPLQLLAYELAVLRGINPDKPRGLAKTVTVC